MMLTRGELGHARSPYLFSDSRWCARLHQTVSADEPESWQQILTAVCHDSADDLHGVEEPNICGRDGFAPLHFAAWMGATRVSEYLLQRGADASQSNVVRKINDWADCSGPPIGGSWRSSPLFEPVFGITPLFLAANAGQVGVVDLLLRHCADKEKATSFLSNEHEFLLRDMIAKGIDFSDFEPVDWPSLTAIEIAAECGHADVCRRLLQDGAGLRSSPLRAAMQESSATLDVLLGKEWPCCKAHGAYVALALAACSAAVFNDQQLRRGPLSLVLEHPCMDGRVYQCARFAIQFLLGHVCGNQSAPRQLLLKMQLLLQHGADMNGLPCLPSKRLIDPDANMPTINVCCGTACHDFLKGQSLVLQSGSPESTYRSELAKTPITVAIEAGHMHVAYFLLVCGCSPDLRGGSTIRQLLEEDHIQQSDVFLLLTASNLYPCFLNELTIAERHRVPSLQILCRCCITRHAPGPRRLRSLPVPGAVKEFLLFQHELRRLDTYL